jgi:hypothetical protein
MVLDASAGRQGPLDTPGRVTRRQTWDEEGDIMRLVIPFA